MPSAASTGWTRWSTRSIYASRRLRAGDADVDADAVVLATGLSYRTPPIPGLDGAHVNATPGGMRRLAAALAGGPRRVAVIGGGLIGVETAATLATQGHAVTVLDLLERPLDRLHDPLPAIAAATLAELGVTFLGGAAIEEAAEVEAQVTLCHKEGSVEADVVVAATGGRAASPPGLELDAPLEVGSDMRVPGQERVHACGDLVLVPHARFGPMRFPHWDAAIGTGEQAADAIAGQAGPYERLPYWWSDIGPRRLAEVGFAEAAESWAEEKGLHVGQGRRWRGCLRARRGRAAAAARGTGTRPGRNGMSAIEEWASSITVEQLDEDPYPDLRADAA